MAQESAHLDSGVQHGIVHIDIDNARSAFNLAGGNLQRFVVLPGGNQARELARTGHIGTLSDIGEIAALLVYGYRLQATESQHILPA